MLPLTVGKEDQSQTGKVLLLKPDLIQPKDAMRQRQPYGRPQPRSLPLVLQGGIVPSWSSLALACLLLQLNTQLWARTPHTTGC